MPNSEARGVWPAFPGGGLEGCQGNLSSKRNQRALVTSKPGSPSGSQAKWGLNVARLKEPPQKDLGEVGPFSLGAMQVVQKTQAP